MKRNFKWAFALCAILVLMLGLLSGCGDKKSAEGEELELYWNVEGNNYLGKPGEVAVRRMESDGYYYVRFAHGGAQERYKVTEDVIKKGLDLYKLVGLIFDENGIVVDFQTVEECRGDYFAKEFFVESIDGSTVTCNSAPTFEGYQKTFELTDDINVYYVEGNGPLVGMEAKIQLDDEITVICDREGKITDCYVKPLPVTPTVYFSKVRMYNSTSKSTTRESDLAGTYSFEMAVNGGPVTVKTKDAAMASKMDSFAARNMILTFDEDGYVDSAVSGDATCGAWSSWFNVLEVDGQYITTVRSRQATNLGTKNRAQMARNFVAYDVNPYAEVYGAVTELRKGDTVHCLKNSRGQIAIAFVVNRKMDGEVYWNVTRMYNSTTKETTRVPNEEGWYEILLTTRGEQFTLKTKDKELVTKIDARADKHCGLVVEDGIIKEFYTPADITGGGVIASWFDLMHISEDGKKIGALRTIDSNIGAYYEVLLADDCMIYDVSGQGDFVGQITELQMYDRIHGELNDEGKLGIVYVVRRLADSDMYWNVEQKYNDTTKSTTRTKGSDGYYRVVLAVNGKQATYKVADKEVMNSIDKRPYLRSFGVELEGNVITKVYEPGLVTGGGGFASWADITSIEDGVITAVKTTKSDTQKMGTVYTAKMAEDCEVYDVTELAKLDSFIGVKTTPRIGDRIYGHLNLQGEIEVLYIVGNRLKNGYLAWNFARKYDATNKVSTREPDEDGWYKVDLAVNGKQVVWKTQDEEMINKIDSAYWSGLVVNKDGEILAHYPYNLIYGGYSQASWYDVTRISGNTITAERKLAGKELGKVVTFRKTYNCDVYDVSDSYVNYKGEPTTLRVGDRIHVMNASNNIDARVIYIVWRPDTPGEPDHFHCECGAASASGVGGHVCDEKFGWSAWTNSRRLPTSGNWYLATDVTLTASASIPATNSLKICLNGHTINGSQTGRIYYSTGDLTFTDCHAPAEQGQIIANSNTNGSIVYVGPSTDGSKFTVYGGTYKNSLEKMSKSGAIIFVGDKVGIAKMDIYGGTFVGANNSYPGANFYVMGDSYVNMYGGTLTGGTTTGNGGNMYVNAGQINLYGGTITGGKAALGGSIYMSTGTLGLHGTDISDGTVVLVKVDAEVTGGTISGGLDVQGQSAIALSGNPVISGGTAYNLRLSGCKNVTLGDFTDGAEIRMRSTVLNVPLGTLADPADKGYFFCDDDDASLEFNADNQLILKASHTHCDCGTGAFNGVGTHTCDATAGWVKWTDATKLPTTSGYYYLATDVTMTAGASIGAAADIHLCLNGHTINGPTTARIYYTAGKLTITDCKPVAEQGQVIANANQPGAVAYVGPTKQGSLLTIFGGTYKSSLEKTTKIGAIIFVGDSKEGIAKMDMYGGSIIGTKSTTSGASLYMMWDAYVNLYGGTISGGNSSTYGGNIFVHSGELNLLGGTVTGGKAAVVGANIHMADGTLNVHSGNVSEGHIYVAKGKVNVTGGTISGGLNIQSPVVAEISGKPVISGGAYNLRVHSAENVTIGDLQTGAEIYIGTTTMDVPVATLANLEDKAFLKADNDDILEVNAEKQIIVKAIHVHCDCGTGAFDGVGTHTCDATVGWTKWTDATTLPTTSGYYYLGTDVTMTAGLSLAASADVHLCLNGYTVNGPTTARVYYTAGKLTFTDCKPVAEQGQVIANANQPGAVAYVGPTKQGSLLTIFGGTYKSSLEKMTKVGSIIFIGDSKDGISDMDMYGGTIIGTKNTTSGAAMYIMWNSHVNLYGGTIQGGNSNTYGGNIFVHSGELNLLGGTVTGGKAAIVGANIHMADGTLNVHSGNVSEGHIYVAKGKVNVTGGTISGGLNIQSSVVAEISGKPVISGGAYNLRVHSAENVTIGDLQTGAEIYIGTTTMGVPVATLANLEDKEFLKADNDDILEVNAEKQIIVKAIHVHCDCGTGAFDGVGTHTCDATVGWVRWTDATKLPTTSGYYYLGTDVTMTAGLSLAASADVHLCLNGYTVNGPTAARIYYTAGKLTITDCKPVAEQGQMIANSNTNGSVVYVGPSKDGSKFTVYGGTYKNSLENLSKSGAIVFVGDKTGIAKMDIYGGTFAGANNSYSGANFYVMGDSYINMYGGTITGGNSKSTGGNMYVNAGQINLYGGTITGGNSSSYGGNIFVNSGELNLLGGIVTGGKAAYVGANIHMADGTLNVHSGTVSEGHIYAAKGKVNVTGGTISGGLNIQSSVVAEISGKPVISGGAYNLRVHSAENVTIGDLQTGAEIYIGTTTMDVPVATLANLEDKEFLKADNDDILEVNAEKQIIVKAIHVHCDCGTGAFDGVGTHTCDATVGWVRWTDATKLPTTSGYYYLGTDVTMTAGLSLAASADVHLCLNGYTVNGPTAARIYYTAGKLTITDCKPVAEQGQMIANSNTNGSVVYVGPSKDGSKFTVYGGTYKNSLEKLSKSGAIIFVGDKTGIAKMDIYGGTFVGTNNDYPGANFYVMGDSYINMYGGTITGGNSKSTGGSMYVNAGQINLYGGTISGGNSSTYGGNIFVNSGELNLLGGTVTGGKAAVVGANIHMADGTLNVHSGNVSEGHIYVAKGKVNVTGGTISGGLNIQSPVVAEISGKPVIFGGTYNLRVADGTKIKVGDLTDGAKIGLFLAKEGDKVGPLNDPAYKNYFFGDKKYAQLLMDSENKLYEKLEEHKHCVCGGAPTAAEVGHACDETVQWKSISAALDAAGLTENTADFGKLPSGNYFLDTDIVVTGSTGTKGKEVRLCLNGYNITTSAARVFPSFKESTLEITDCSYDATSQTWGGTVYGGSSAYGGIIYTDDLTCLNIYGGNFTDGDAEREHSNGGLFALANETSKTDATKKAVMNVYGGNIHGAKAATGGLITVFQFSELNIYGGTLQNGTATSGGLIAFSSEGVLNIFGGTFKNGIVSSMGTLHRGGAIYINRGTLNVKGGTFVGNVAFYGGAIYAIAATENVPVEVNLEGGKFYTATDYADTTSNRAYHYGGNIYMEGSKAAAKLNIKDGADIGYGHTTNTTFASEIIASGGNIYAKNVTIHMAGGSVIGGKAVAGGNIFIANGNSNYQYPLTISGGTVSGGQAVHDDYPNATYKNADKKTVTVYPAGGNISVNGNEKLVITGGIVENGTSSHAGGNIAMNDTADLQISNGQILGGTSAHGGNIYAKKGMLNMHSGTVSAGSASVLGGNVYLSGANLNMLGGTISNGTVVTAAAADATGKVSVTGGTISGGLWIQGGATLSLSGKPVISGNTAYNLRLSSSVENVTIGDLETGAEVYISTEKLNEPIATIANQEDKSFLFSDDGNAVEVNEQKQVYIKANHFHCVCGGATTATAANHVCSDVAWMPISRALAAVGLTAQKADFGKLPSGNYFLDTDVVVAGSTGTKGKEVRLCLNGHNITTTVARVFPSFKESTLEITDCSYDATSQTWGGTVYGGSSDYAGIIYTDDLTRLNIYGGNFTDGDASRNHKNGGLFVLANETSKTDATKKAVMNVYGGNIHGAKATTGGLISVFQLSELNIYGGTLSGGTATNGGLIAFSSAGTFNVFGGTLTGGSATTGGAIYVSAGTLNVKGGTLTKGTATNGGLIAFSSTGELNINGGLLFNDLGAAPNSYGGAIYITKGTLNVTGGTFTGNAAYWGGAIAARPGKANDVIEINIEGGVFDNNATGYATAATFNKAYNQGGNIYVTGRNYSYNSETKKYDIPFYAASATLNIKPGADIAWGNTTNAATGSGGNIYAEFATVNMTGGTVANGQACQGGNFFLANSSTGVFELNISGGTVSGGRAFHKDYPTAKNGTATIYPIGGNISVNGDEKVIISGTAEIKDGVASHAGGNIGVNDTADLEVSGGQILGGTAAHGGNIFTNDNVDVKVKISGGKISGGTLDRSKAVGTGRCIRLHTNVKLTLEGKPEVEEITFTTSGSNTTATTKIDATGMQSLETPIKICLNATTHTNFVFADVDEDLSGSFILSAIYWDTTNKVQSYNEGKGHSVYNAENNTLSVVIHATNPVAEKAATCTEAGHKAYRDCTECDYKSNITLIDALNHDWDEGTVTTPPTSEAEGVKTFTCKREGCGETKTEPVEKLETE